MRKWINEMPGALIVPAAFVALATYRAAMNPPGRFWNHGHAAGQPVMLTKFPASYAWFRVLNSIAFGTSLTVIWLILTHRLYGTPPAWMTTTLALFDMLCFVATLFCASFPDDPVGGGFTCLLGAVLICLLAYSGVYIGKRVIQ